MKRVQPEDLRWLEDILARDGIYSLCRDTESDMRIYGYRGDPDQLIGDPNITAVVTSLEDVGKMHRSLRSHMKELSNRFGSDYTIGHEFWPYFLCYQEMGRISVDSPHGFFLSTVIVDEDGLGTNAQLPHLDFDLQITMIKASATAEDIRLQREKIQSLIRAFNQRSRYLKVREVRTAYSTTKFIFKGDPEPTYEPLTI